MRKGGAERLVQQLLSTESDGALLTLSTPVQGNSEFSVPNVERYGRDVTTVSGLLYFVRYLFRFSSATKIFHMYHSMLLGGLLTFLSRSKADVWFFHHEDPSSPLLKVRTRLIVLLLKFLSWFLRPRAIFVSDLSLKSHKKFGFRFKDEMVIHLGSLRSFERDKLRRSVGSSTSNNVERFLGSLSVAEQVQSPASALRVGCLARWSPVKGHAFLFRSLKEVVDVDISLHLAGPGLDYHNRDLMELLTASGLATRTTLYGPVDDVARFYDQLDLHVLVSQSESFGLVTLEALSCGTMCGATRVGAQPDLIGDDRFLCDYDDVQGLLKIIKNVAYLPVHQKQLFIAERSRAIKHRYSVENMRAEFFSFALG